MNHEVKSAARVLELIEFLAGCSEPVTLKEITTELGCPKSSAHALAQTLVSRGYAIQDSADRYLLVHGNRHGSSVRAREARLLSAAHPVMEGLRDHSGETVLLSVRTVRGEIKRLAKCVSRQSVRYDTDLDRSRGGVLHRHRARAAGPLGDIGGRRLFYACTACRLHTVHGHGSGAPARDPRASAP